MAETSIDPCLQCLRRVTDNGGYKLATIIIDGKPCQWCSYQKKIHLASPAFKKANCEKFKSVM